MLTRRQLLAGATGAAIALGTGRPTSARSATKPRLPHPSQSGIDHVVVLCMENRSFDHFLGWAPGADGQQAGRTYLDDEGVRHSTHRLDEWQGCVFADPDHSYAGGRIQLDGGSCRGFRKGANDDFALGYYDRDDLQTYSAVVDGYTIFDRWFCGILGPTYPNRLYTHAAATDRISNDADTSSLRTVWDGLGAGGVPAAYYFSDLPVLALWGAKHVSFGRPFASFFVDAAAGRLPAFSYLDPFFLGEDQGGSNDDHPHADIRRGQALVGRVARAVMASPTWASTLLLVTYDEWGGFFDHVRPPQLPDAFTPTQAEEHNTAGFRVPTMLISPFAQRGHVAHARFDHGSIPALVNWRFGLQPLTPRDAAAGNPATVLDFTRPNLRPAPIPEVADPGPHLCGSPHADAGGESAFWRDLAGTKAMRSWEWIG